MEPLSMEIDTNQQLSADPLPFARSYQMEALEEAIKHNTIVFLETGSGKTLIAIMLLRSYAYLLRKPSPFIAVFLVPKVVLVPQQANAVKLHTDLNVGMYWGDMGVDYWNASTWKQEIDKNEVLVMTPQILLSNLRHSFFKLSMIKVLIFDECHHAKGRDPYACIMTEFYHRQLHSRNSDLPRIFGMTASPIKSKGCNSDRTYWKKIRELETMMNSKVYTCVSESVLSEFIPFSTPKLKLYKHKDIPCVLYGCLTAELKILEEKHKFSIKKLDINKSAAESLSKKISKISSTLEFCLSELGVWLASKAAESLARNETDIFSWGKMDLFGEKFVKEFSLDAFKAFSTCIPSDPEWSIGDDVNANVNSGLLTAKVVCLVDSLLEYRGLEDMRCIIFVERVISSIVIQSLLSELLPDQNSWKTKYIAGNNSGLQSQTRRQQNEIVEEFRKGVVNIIVATSILEEGLDVQSCNLVIRFDPCATVCSFIQSRGRARMQNSDYLLLVKSGDLSTLSRLENFLASGKIMRKESLCHASVPCAPLESDLYYEEFYHVKSTGATVTLSSSVSLIYFYCSRLPSDGYFKPAPKFNIDKNMATCSLHLPKNCPVQTVCVQGNINMLKQTACLEACKQLHEAGALTDNLVPEIVVEEDDAELVNEPYNDEQPSYFPPELINCCSNKSKEEYHWYLIELKQDFNYDIPVHHIVLVMRCLLESDIRSIGFELEVDRGTLTVKLNYVGIILLSPEQVLMCRRFQTTLFRVLRDHKLTEVFDRFHLPDSLGIDYFVLPSISIPRHPYIIDWKTISSVMFSCGNVWKDHKNCSLPKGYAPRVVQTKNGLVCSCMLQNSLVYTPHNGQIYCVTGILEELDSNSLLSLRNGSAVTYKEYYEDRHSIKLCFEQESLLIGRRIFPVQNCLIRCRQRKQKESLNVSVELPPELCVIIMSPITISTFYSFSFVPSIMHRLESMLLALNLKRLHMDHCMQNVDIPTIKVLEAITTKKCQEKFHLESLETLGDSFLKYAASQQLFKIHQNHHEGLLSIKKEKIISNAALCKLGCNRKLPGFIRNECFDPKEWTIPGDKPSCCLLNEEVISNTRKIYVKESRKVKSKTVADVVEALIGAFISTGGEIAGLLFMDWLGVKIDFLNVPYERHFQVHPEKLVNVRHMESLLNYSFNDPTLLVEALTHGSYMLPEIPRCYQRLEFLGDSVLDYLVTLHLYNEYPGMSPGLLTDLRSASVNNDCYAQSAVKAGLYKHILHASQDLHKHIIVTVSNFEISSMESTFGWESETSFPKVLGDVIESLAGAILVDSGYNKEIVFRSIRPLLEPLITPETVRLHPVRELNELCQKEHYTRKKPTVAYKNGVASITIEVEANGKIHKHTSKGEDKKTAKKLASKEILKSLKESLSAN